MQRASLARVASLLLTVLPGFVTAAGAWQIISGMAAAPDATGH